MNGSFVDFVNSLKGREAFFVGINSSTLVGYALIKGIQSS